MNRSSLGWPYDRKQVTAEMTPVAPVCLPSCWCRCWRAWHPVRSAGADPGVHLVRAPAAPQHGGRAGQDTAPAGTLRGTAHGGTSSSRSSSRPVNKQLNSSVALASSGTWQAAVPSCDQQHQELPGVAICRAAAKTRTREWRPCWTGYGTCRNFMRHYAWRDKQQQTPPRPACQQAAQQQCSTG
jgi:hypothetical protein